MFYFCFIFRILYHETLSLSINVVMGDLASYAIHTSTGRQYPEVLDDGRGPFHRDRDRIIHSKAFRRLDRKTQVLVSGTGDHYRTRLTHSLEVAQISRDLARRLHLNEDLCEAIALAHDLGHPPFGHVGEHALDDVMKEFGMNFEHNEQSRRIVEVLEKGYPTFDGLNLTNETIEGLIKHQTAYDQEGKKFNKFSHLEAQIVNVADEIAYNNHDIDDGIRLGVLKMEDLEEVELWRIAKAVVLEKFGEIDFKKYRQRIISVMISMMVEDFYSQTTAELGRNNIKTLDDVKNFEGLLGKFSDRMKEKIKELRTFLFQRFYMHPTVLEKVNEGSGMIKKLFKYYLEHPDKFPKGNNPSVEQIKDYIAGMTDGFLLKEFKKI